MMTEDDPVTWSRKPKPPGEAFVVPVSSKITTNEQRRLEKHGLTGGGLRSGFVREAIAEKLDRLETDEE